MNKQTIQDVDEALDRWHRKLTTCVRKIDELRAKRKKMVTGKSRCRRRPASSAVSKSPITAYAPIRSAISSRASGRSNKKAGRRARPSADQRARRAREARAARRAR